MLKLIRTDSGNADFKALVHFLDRELQVLDGDDHAYYAQFNKIEAIKNVVVAYWGNVPAGCGAIKPWSEGMCELKRMYVPPDLRRRGIADSILKELERWAGELSFTGLVLETGVAQPEAIGLYRKNGYRTMPNYGQYAGMEASVCMQKMIVIQS